jgi:hypothetical protein
MAMNQVFEKLTDYTLALKAALDSTNEANERPVLTKHLAVAAEIYATLHQFGDVESARKIVEGEIRHHGWSFMSGTEGEDIANKWVAFTDSLGIKQ